MTQQTVGPAMRENMTLADLSEQLTVPLAALRRIVCGIRRNGGPEPEPASRYTSDEGFDVRPFNGGYSVLWRQSAWGDGELVYDTTVSVAFCGSDAEAQREAALRRAAMSPSPAGSTAR